MIISSAFLIIFGILVAILPHIAPTVSYDSLQTKEVTITVFKHFYGGAHGASYDYIRTTDGEEYNISGDYQREQLIELLTQGRTVTIKWYKNNPFWTLLAEEIYVDGERVVTYNNDLPVDWKSPLLFGSFLIALGVGGFFLLRFFLKTNRTKQKKRDEKIKRKYGNVTK
ncbi:MAG: hypothetical protein SPI15_04790 [Candidatus Faecousia sp.]|nr:hypothetical protein [Clostridiales bacterium]MDY6180151.1 hypothetical protein [Candidatus Faecousia sp.]